MSVPASSTGSVECTWPDMSLRDWFAGHAPDRPKNIQFTPDEFTRFTGRGMPSLDDTIGWMKYSAAMDAAWRYAYADAMIAERGRGR